MSIDCGKSLLFGLLFGIALAGYPCAAAGEEMSAAEVWELLPKGIDAEDDGEIANYVKLVEEGEAIYGALLDILRGNNDPLIAGPALSVLRASKSDNRNARRDVVAELGRILHEKRAISDEWESWTLSLMAEAIADMGDAEDAQLLAPLLDHPNGDVRSAGYSGMEKLTAKAVSQESPAGGNPFGQDNGNAATESEPVPQAKKTYRDYPEWNYFPRDLDSEDRAESDAYLRLIEEGAAASEAMMAIVRQCDDPCIVSTALSVLKKSAGDKRAAVGELKPLFAERILRSEGDDEIAGYMAMALAAMGEEEDMSVLLPMLAHPCRRLRIIGTRCIGQRGGLAALEALEQARSSDTDALVREEIGKAISAIETRLAAQDTGEEAVP